MACVVRVGYHTTKMAGAVAHAGLSEWTRCVYFARNKHYSEIYASLGLQCERVGTEIAASNAGSALLPTRVQNTGRRNVSGSGEHGAHHLSQHRNAGSDRRPSSIRDDRVCRSWRRLVQCTNVGSRSANSATVQCCPASHRFLAGPDDTPRRDVGSRLVVGRIFWVTAVSCPRR